jgi:hypothetical protein
VIPATKQDPGEDPETISNLEGNLNDQDLDAFVAVNQDTNPAQSDSKNIRIIGPVFLQNTDAVNLK